jgi:ketosteroid isomerase-like protein
VRREDMTPHDERSDREAQIRQLLGARVKAVRAKDVTAVMTAYAPDVVAFDLAPPPEYRGAAANRRSLEEWFPTFRGPLGYEIRDLAITAGDEVAFSHSLNRISGARTDGTETTAWAASAGAPTGSRGWREGGGNTTSAARTLTGKSMPGSSTVRRSTGGALTWGRT